MRALVSGFHTAITPPSQQDTKCPPALHTSHIALALHPWSLDGEAISEEQLCLGIRVWLSGLRRRFLWLPADMTDLLYRALSGEGPTGKGGLTVD